MNFSVGLERVEAAMPLMVSPEATMANASAGVFHGCLLAIASPSEPVDQGDQTVRRIALK